MYESSHEFLDYRYIVRDFGDSWAEGIVEFIKDVHELGAREASLYHSISEFSQELYRGG